MRLPALGLVVVTTVVLARDSAAIVRPKGAEAPLVSADRAPRSHRAIAWSRAGQLAPYGLAGWTAMLDDDTRVPLRMWGPNAKVAGAVADAGIAEATARAFLAQHLDLLAPGAQLADFVVAGNQLGGAGNTRSVGFSQRYRGARVVDAAIGFTFKADRLVMVGATALPNVKAAQPAQRLALAELSQHAERWLASDGQHVAQRGTAELVVLPVVRPRTGAGIDAGYRFAEELTLAQTDGPGRWIVWLDAATGAPIARKSTIAFSAMGTVMYDVPDRGPYGARHPQPAQFANQTVNGQQVTEGSDGMVTWASGAATISPSVEGTVVAVSNASGGIATGSLTLANGGSVTWSFANTERSDAQLDSYVYANQVKAFAKARLNPNLAWLDEQLSVNVNENSTCNAYSTGDDIHFYVKGGQCENTGRLSDVVYHEFGHSMHNHSVIPGVGQFDGSLSEGLADTMAASITGDHGMGRGFFGTSAPLRDLEPATPKKWPDDADGEPHDEGEIIAEALWDTRKALEAKLGQPDGYAKTLEIYYGVMQRASDIPSSYAEALVADDDNGDVSDGTPNQCEINQAFARHGLASGTAMGSVGAPTRSNFTITLATSSSPGCASPAIGSVAVDWRPRGGTGGTIMLTESGGTYTGDIPTQPDGTVVEYKVSIALAAGGTVAYPNNPADPYYQFYVGPVTPLWCADFENGAGDWTHGGTPQAADEWEAGAPAGLAGDPRSAHGGTAVFGIDLTKDGAYTKSSTLFAESPDIDLAGHPDARLQYYRWLGVEDGFYDKARVLANGTELWTNFASSAAPNQAGVNHLDKEWRFQDLDLASVSSTGKVKLRFELASDEGLQFGGWTLDDVCIVVPGAAPSPTCGNGQLDDGEQCDDGNTTDGDGCSATCQNETPGGGSGSGDDDGGGGKSAGCCSTSSKPDGVLALAALVLGVLLRRKRYSAS